MEVLLVLVIWVGPLLVAWGLIYLAVKYGVLNALRQHDRERRGANPRG